MTVKVKVGLTPEQQRLLGFIRAFHVEHGVYPTVREMASGKIDGEQVLEKRRSISNVHRMLVCLQEKGWILREIASHRGIAVLP
tara:strand:+ start:172 stop:423 length:252 start_codon:yes stop_codon:yes gene_type:complete